jgi:hypothetical protein
VNIKEVRDAIRGLGGPGSGQKGHTTAHDKAESDHAAAVAKHEAAAAKTGLGPVTGNSYGSAKDSHLGGSVTTKDANGTEWDHPKGRLPQAEITDDEMEAIVDRKPDESIDTGNATGEAASNLEIHYLNDTTIVSPGGEYQNADSWKHPGKISPENVLKDYHKAFDSKERKNLFNQHDYTPSYLKK